MPFLSQLCTTDIDVMVLKAFIIADTSLFTIFYSFTLVHLAPGWVSSTSPHPSLPRGYKAVIPSKLYTLAHEAKVDSCFGNQINTVRFHILHTPISMPSTTLSQTNNDLFRSCERF